MPTIVVPSGFSYVLGSLLLSPCLLLWQSIVVGGARKKAGIKYPQAYAEKAEAAASIDAQIFNCTQRAHSNTLEALPIVMITTVIYGLSSPNYAAIANSLWVASRILYTLGYISGEPKNRHNMKAGSLGFLISLGLLFGAAWSTWNISKVDI